MDLSLSCSNEMVTSTNIVKPLRELSRHQNVIHVAPIRNDGSKVKAEFQNLPVDTKKDFTKNAPIIIPSLSSNQSSHPSNYDARRETISTPNRAPENEALQSEPRIVSPNWPIKKPGLEKLVEEISERLVDNKQWSVTKVNGVLIISKLFKGLFKQRVSIKIDASLNLTMSVGEHNLPINHKYFSYVTSLYVTSNHPFLSAFSCVNDVIKMVQAIEPWNSCMGVKVKGFEFCIQKNSPFYKVCSKTETARATNCELLFKLKNANVCGHCKRVKKLMRKSVTRNSLSINVKNKKRILDLKEVVRKEKLKNLKKGMLDFKKKALERRIRKSIIRSGVDLTCEESATLQKIFKENPWRMRGQFFTVLEKEQRKIACSKSSRSKKWHPVILSWCIYASRKPAMCGDKPVSVFALPNGKELFDFTDLLSKKSFDENSFALLRLEAKQLRLSSEQKYNTLALEEIKIKDDLVFKKSSGEFIGYVNLNFATFKLQRLEECTMEGKSALSNGNENTLLLVTIRSMKMDFYFPIGLFSCKNLTNSEFYNIVFESMKKLLVANMKVLLITCDSPKYFKMCVDVFKLDKKVPHKTKNVLYSNKHKLYFMLDHVYMKKLFVDSLISSLHILPDTQPNKPLHCIEGASNSWTYLSQLSKMDPEFLYLTGGKQSKPNFASAKEKIKLAEEILSRPVSQMLTQSFGKPAKPIAEVLGYCFNYFEPLTISYKLVWDHEDTNPTHEPYEVVGQLQFLNHFMDIVGVLDEKPWLPGYHYVFKDFEKNEKLSYLIKCLKINAETMYSVVKFMLRKTDATYVVNTKLFPIQTENFSFLSKSPDENKRKDKAEISKSTPTTSSDMEKKFKPIRF